MAYLIQPPDTAIGLRPLAYQQVGDLGRPPDEWDLNWLVVSLVVFDGRTRWRTVSTGILTWELHGLVRWLREIAGPGSSARRTFTTLEPRLHLAWLGEGDAAVLRAEFGYKLHPSRRPQWSRGTRDVPDPHVVQLAASAAALRQFADDLEQELTAFPVLWGAEKP